MPEIFIISVSPACVTGCALFCAKRKELKRNGGKQQDEGDAGEIHLLPVPPSFGEAYMDGTLDIEGDLYYGL